MDGRPNWRKRPRSVDDLKSYVKRATMHENAAAGQLLKQKLTTLVSCERLRSKTVC